jgi:stage II sporulation protein D
MRYEPMKPLGKGILVATVFLILILPAIMKLIPQEGQPTDQLDLEDDPDEIIIVMDSEEVIVSMYDQKLKELVKLPLEEYLIGVVAGEMPAGFDSEALKAQAVAARTLVIAKMPAFGGRGCNQKQGADVCSSFAHCQEWISEDLMRRNWGEDFDVNYAKIKEAVADTRGEIMMYNGRPIEVLYHSTSNGMTEEAGEVFSQSLPYYTTVKSEGEENAPKFEDSVTITNQRFADIFKERYNIKLNPDKLDKEIKINGYTDSGRIRDLTIGGKVLRATEFRLLYGLNSTDITFIFGKDSITMKTKGFGHGVGMSQVGADQMAKKGYNYKDILCHYYRGVDIGHY